MLLLLDESDHTTVKLITTHSFRRETFGRLVVKMINIIPEACQHNCKHKPCGIRHAQKQHQPQVASGWKVICLVSAEVADAGNTVVELTVFFL